MTFRNWYLGIAAAGAALLPLSANAGLLTGSYNGEVYLTLNGVTTETSALGVDPTTGQPTANGGSCNASFTNCAETTWGAGVISESQKFLGNQPLWVGETTSPPQALAFVISGIADQSVTETATNPNPQFTINNVGATSSIYGVTNGHINIQLYTFPAATAPQLAAVPCFQTGCQAGGGGNYIIPSDRTPNSANGLANVTGITDVGTLFADIELIPGIVPSTNVLLQQTANSNTLPASGDGSFYANCISGPGCAEFGETDAGNFNGVLADFFGKFDLNVGTDPNWLGDINDPIFALAVPEPGSLALLGSCLALLGLACRRWGRKGSFKSHGAGAA